MHCWTDGATALKMRPSHHGWWAAVILSQRALRPKQKPPFLISVPSIRSDNAIH